MGQGKPEQFNIYKFYSFESVVCFTDIFLLCGGWEGGGLGQCASLDSRVTRIH